MTTYKEQDTHAPAQRLTLAEILEIFAAGQLPLKFTAYDGSTAGPEDANLGLDLLTPRARPTSPPRRATSGWRAYVSGDLEPHGVHPGDPYELLRALADKMDFKRPPARVLANIIRSIGFEHLKPIAPPPQEALPRWRRIAEGLRHSKTRDAEAIHHHYDVSNTFYEWVLGPSMTYTCACYPHPDASLEEAQENKYRLVFEKLRPAGRSAAGRGLRLGRHGPLRRSARRQGDRCHPVEGAGDVGAEGHRRAGLTDLAEVRHGDYRDVAESAFDAVSSIGLTEHIGVHNYPSYFGFLKSKMRNGACYSTTASPGTTTGGATAGFIDRYVFPDGELTGSSRIITEAQDAGLEVVHEEKPAPPLRADLRDWCRQPRRALG